MQDLQKQWSDASARRRELESRKQILEGDLRQNLRMKEDQLTSRVFETISPLGAGDNYEDAQKILVKLQVQADDVEKKYRRTVAEMEAQRTKITKLELQIAEQEQALLAVRQDLDRHRKKLEKSRQRKALVIGQLTRRQKTSATWACCRTRRLTSTSGWEASTVSRASLGLGLVPADSG